MLDVTSPVHDHGLELKDIYLRNDSEATVNVEASASSDLPRNLPNMWSKDFIGLYAQYAAVGLLYGSAGTLLPLCSYVYNGESNLCANASNLYFFAWNFKIFYAILTDSVHPFGLRRRPWMLFGFSGVFLILLILAVVADRLEANTWLLMLLVLQLFLMFSDVPADGYSVELGQLEPEEQRGQILATGQLVRMGASVFAGVLQTFLLNGPSTNAPDCPISFSSCWSWGLTVRQYYGTILVIVAVLIIPIFYLKELEFPKSHRYSCGEFFRLLWVTMQNLTTLYLLIFAIGTGSFTNFLSNVNIFIQYYVIDLTSFQAGIDTISTYGSIVLAIYVFKRCLIRRNWRWTQYLSVYITSALGIVWILVYYNVGGLMNPWFTIFIDLDQNFSMGLTQVLISMSVIELARPGQEATTYELIITVSNAAATVAQVLATQLLTPLQADGCDSPPCPSTSVDISSPQAFRNSGGPLRFTKYCLVLIGISLGANQLFTPFLPKSIQHCEEWKKKSKDSDSLLIGRVSLILSVITILYGLIVAFLLLDPATSCKPEVGGSGC